ncbi:MAG: transcription initiation factor IIB [Candidatus Marsarchaeota archaeon]|nr:transcription initiation factor IIB [Candidatus Marsarchaeota archaeon]
MPSKSNKSKKSASKAPAKSTAAPKPKPKPNSQANNARRIVVSGNKLSIEDTNLQQKPQHSNPGEIQTQNQSQEQFRKELGTVGSSRRCPSCGSTDIIFDSERGEQVCNNCGLVIEESITDTGPEWRAFDADQRAARARTGAPIKYTKPNKGLVTEIDAYNKDIRGVRIPSKRQAQLYRMRKWHKRASIASSSERNYLIALPELNRVASYLGLPDNIRESAALLYRKCVQNNLIRGRPIETVVQAVIYAACRAAGMPRTLDEIAQISGLPKKEIGRAYRVISHELNLKIPLTDPISYVPRYVNALKLSGEAQEKAAALLKNAMKKGLVSGRSPTGVSAAAVYIAGALAGERRTQKEVADVAGVTEVTIRNRYRELKEQLNIDVNL